MTANGRWDEWQVHDEKTGQRKYLSQKEFGSFVHAASNLEPSIRALCEVIAYSGCRISEALALTVGQFDRDLPAVTFRTLKRRKPVFRTVPIPPPTAELLWVLSSTSDDRFWPMHRATAWRVVKATMRRAGIIGPMSTAKGLRHGFAMRAVGQNVPIGLIQRWMGHASMTTTSHYLQAVDMEERRFASRTWTLAP